METEQTSFADLASGPRRGEYPLPTDGHIERCRSCDAQIVWTHTPAGRAIPLSLATVQTRDGETYCLSHFTDCPHGRAWSRKGSS
jgi:hypothetical protein